MRTARGAWARGPDHPLPVSPAPPFSLAHTLAPGACVCNRRVGCSCGPWTLPTRRRLPMAQPAARGPRCRCRCYSCLAMTPSRAWPTCGASPSSSWARPAAQCAWQPQSTRRGTRRCPGGLRARCSCCRTQVSGGYRAAAAWHAAGCAGRQAACAQAGAARFGKRLLASCATALTAGRALRPLPSSSHAGAAAGGGACRVTGDYHARADAAAAMCPRRQRRYRVGLARAARGCSGGQQRRCNPWRRTGAGLCARHCSSHLCGVAGAWQRRWQRQRREQEP